MTEFLEAVAIPSSGHDPEKCCFCPLEKEQEPTRVAKIGKHHNSNTLGKNLEIARDAKSDHLYVDSVHGEYSLEAHHLICCNEILAEEKEVEKYLITQNKNTTKGAPGLIENTLHDVDWDVNAARNGIWLPSVPDLYRVVDGDPEIWWGKQTKKSEREFLSETDKENISYIVMKAVSRQFHKGSHTSAAPPHQSYVELGLDNLSKIKKVLKYYSKNCPMEDGNNTKRDNPPYRPPHKIAKTLDLLSDVLKNELIGAPSTWKYFISKFAFKCQAWDKLN